MNKDYRFIILVLLMMGIYFPFSLWYGVNTATILLQSITYKGMIGQGFYEFITYGIEMLKFIILLYPIFIIMVGLDTIDKIKTIRKLNGNTQIQRRKVSSSI